MVTVTVLNCRYNSIRRGRRQHTSEKDIWIHVQEVMRGVEYPHNSSLVDRNIRARTCLLIAGTETVKLLDIENAALLENGTTSSDTQTIDEAIGHMSPEMLTCFDSNENGSCS